MKLDKYFWKALLQILGFIVGLILLLTGFVWLMAITKGLIGVVLFVLFVIGMLVAAANDMAEMKRW